MNGTQSASMVKTAKPPRGPKPASGTVRLLTKGNGWFCARVQTGKDGKTVRLVDFTASTVKHGVWVAMSTPMPEANHQGPLPMAEAYLVDLPVEACECIDSIKRARAYPVGHDLRPCKHVRALRALIARATPPAE